MISSTLEYKKFLESQSRKVKLENKDLFIVDLFPTEDEQKELIKYCRKFNRTFQFYRNRPDFEYPNQISQIRLPNALEFVPSDLHLYFRGEELERLESKLNGNGFIQGDYFITQELERWVVTEKSGWFRVGPRMDELLTRLKEIEREIVVISSENELDLMTSILKSYEIAFEMDEKFNSMIIHESNHTTFMNCIHVTTCEIAEKIKNEGFKPIKTIDFKYFSELGKNGIYFYTNKRLVQQYAYFLANKKHINKIALIYCKIPNKIIEKNDKLEDGLFVSINNLKFIIIENIKIMKPSDIY